MCTNETIMRMNDLESCLLSMLETEVEKGLENVSAEEMGEVVDMLKDLGEAKYYYSVVMAMEDASEPMGYRRYANGRFAPSGRGKMGYEPMEPHEGRMMDDGMDMGRRDYGGAYGRYQAARMGYNDHATAENRRMMEQTADEHMREFEDSIRDMWEDADQRQRNKMKAALVSMANSLK